VDDTWKGEEDAEAAEAESAASAPFLSAGSFFPILLGRIEPVRLLKLLARLLDLDEENWEREARRGD
jgi:hypothetical protein